MKTKLTFSDIVIVLVISVCTVVISLSFFKKNNGSLFEVNTPQGRFVYSLSEDAEYEFSGKLGVSTIVVSDGKVFFQNSPCPSKNCMSEGAICMEGEFNACLPNGISIRIIGKGDVDDISI